MDNKIISISIIILIIIIFLRLVIPFHEDHCGNHEIHYKILLSKIIPIVKTGDIILFNDNIKIPINIIVGTNKYSHSGIIIVINNIPYIYELIDTQHGYLNHKDMPKFDKSIQLTPLYDRIKYFAGHCYLSSLNKPLNQIQISKLIQYINNSHDYEFVDYKKLFPFMFSTIIIPKKKFCHEFVADILHHLNITSIPIKQRKIFVSQKLIDMCNGDIFSYPIHIIPDDLLISKNVNINKLPKIKYCTDYIKASDII